MQDAKQEPENEIRLVDILAALIRRRNWLIGVTVVGSLLSLVLVFGLPLAGINLMEPDGYSVQGKVKTVQFPPDVQSLINYDYLSLVQSEMQDLNLIADVYKATLMTSREANLESPEFNRIIKNFMKHNLTTTVDPRNGIVVIELKTVVSQRQKGTDFVELLVDRIKTQQILNTQPQIIKLIADLGSTTVQDKSDISTQKQVDYQVKAKALQSILANREFPLALLGPPMVIAEEASLSKPALVGLLVLGSIVLGLFFALIAEGFIKTRNNHEVRELLRRAWQGKE